MAAWFNNQMQNLKINNKNNNGGHSKKQQQSQIYANNQTQQTVQTETMIECVEDTIETVVLAAGLYKKKKLSEYTMNRASDTAIRSLNLLALNCEELYKERDHYTLDLMKKKACDQFAELKEDDIDTYNLLEPHRNFINAALNGQENLRYKTKRVEAASKHLFDNDAKTINKVFSHAVMESQQFDQRQDTFAEPQKNQELKKRHEADINQYRNNNNKYKKTQKHEKFVVPNQSDLYFTESGKQSKFVNKGAENRKQAEQKAMDEDIWEHETDVYDTLKEKQAQQKEIYPYNAVWKLSSKNIFKVNNKTVIKKPICCQILWPNEQNVNRDTTMIMIVPCFPWNNQTRLVKIEDLELGLKKIKQAEKNHNKKFGKLGYKSIEDWIKEAPTDTDFTMNGV